MRSPDVLVVGAGPTGLMASLLLEQQGVSTQIIERRPGPQRAPAAHAVNARTLEICRAAGVDEQALRAAASDPADAGFVYWVTRVGGRVLGRLPYEQQGDDQLDLTPTPLRNISQNRFEPILVDALRRRVGRTPRWNTNWVSSVQNRDGVRTTVQTCDGGRMEEIESRYVIAADGAASGIRKSLDIGFEGPARIQSFIMVHFRARLRGLPDLPPGLLFFVCDPRGHGGVVVVHDLDGDAVYMLPFDPDQESEADYDAERCARLVRTAFEDPSLELGVEAVSSWTMTAQVAERYTQGRIFLAGDAAHRFPPTGGLGLNTGVQDSHNLAWKIAAVLGGRAPETLLDSYAGERRPVAQRNAEQSLVNALRLFEIAQALGVSDFSDASRERMEKTLADPEGLARVRAAIAHQAEHFDMPGLQLGFCYEAGALVRGDDDVPPPFEVRRFSPSGCPGARLPHAWLAGAGGDESLLDRIPIDRFVVVAGPQGTPWIDAAETLARSDVTAWQLDGDRLSGLDRWLERAGIEPDGALLVRPDQHVAWRSRGGSADPAATLRAALADVLGALPSSSGPGAVERSPRAVPG